MLTVLGGLAEFERELIRARTSDGRSRAKARGVRMGRPPKLTRHQREEALAALAESRARGALPYRADSQFAAVSRSSAAKYATLGSLPDSDAFMRSVMNSTSTDPMAWIASCLSRPSSMRR